MANGEGSGLAARVPVLALPPGVGTSGLAAFSFRPPFLLK